MAISTNLTAKLNPYFFGIGLVSLNCVVVGCAMFYAVSNNARQIRLRKEKLARRAVVIEDAREYDANQFGVLFENMDQAIVPASHCMLFWYCHRAYAKRAFEVGIPATAAYDGVVLTLHRPHELDHTDLNAFPLVSRQVVFVCAVPRRFLLAITGESPTLRLVAGDTLKALRGSYFGEVLEPRSWKEGPIFLPPQLTMRALQFNGVFRESVQLFQPKPVPNRNPGRVKRASAAPRNSVPVIQKVKSPAFLSGQKKFRNAIRKIKTQKKLSKNLDEPLKVSFISFRCAASRNSNSRSDDAYAR
jgi:hypothetical protein